MSRPAFLIPRRPGSTLPDLETPMPRSNSRPTSRPDPVALTITSRLAGLFLALILACPLAAADGIALTGKVTDEDSKPVAGARVELRPLESPWEAGRRELAGEPAGKTVEALATATADADGVYRLEVPEIGLWSITAAAAERVSHRREVGPVEVADFLRDLVLTPSERVAVRVVDADGVPLAGARVAAEADGGTRTLRRDPRLGMLTRTPRRAAVTGDDGTVAFEKAPGETLAVTATAPGLVPATVEEAGGREVTLHLAAGAAFEVEVRDDDGKPVPEALLRAGSPHVALGLTGEDGRLALFRDPAKALTLTARTADGRGASLNVEPGALQAEADQPLVLTLPNVVALSGRVLGEEERLPVAGAWVWRAGAPERAVRSDSRGGFSLPLAAAVGATVQADTGGYARNWARLRADQAAGTESLTLLLAPTVAASGRVVDSAGRPVAGADVWAVPSDAGGFRRGSTREQTLTSTDGTFHLPELETDTPYTLHARRDGHAPGLVELAAPADGPTGGALDPVEIVLPDASAAFGRVVDFDENPVAGAEVSLAPVVETSDIFALLRANSAAAGDHQATTDAEGRFEIGDLPSGRFDLTASARRFAPLTVPGVELAEDRSRVDLGTLLLEPGLTLEGQVVDPQGRPVAEADVRSEPGNGLGLRRRSRRRADDSPDATTGPDGRFVVGDLARGVPMTLTIRRKGYGGTDLAGIELPLEEPLTVVLEPSSILSGEVVDTDGQGIEKAGILARGGAAPGPRSRGGSFTRGESGADGRFTVEGVAPGRVTVSVMADGYLEQEKEVEVIAGEDRDDLRFALEPGATITGRVVDASGRPLAEARLRVVSDAPPFGFRGASSAESDADGVYLLAGVPAGEQSVAAEHEGHVRTVRDLTVVIGENRLDFRLEAGLSVAGRVIDEGGAPVAGARVALGGAGGRPASLLSGGEMSDGAGAFRFDGVEPGSYSLTATKGGFAAFRQEEPVEVTAGPVEGLEVVLRRGARVTGRLLGVELGELAGAQVIVGNFADPSRLPVIAPVDYEGRFRLEGIGVGEWTLMALLGDGLPAGQERITIEPGQRELEVDLDLGAGKVTLRGRVFLGDEPMTDSIVALNGHDSAAVGYGQTDHQGRFEVRGLEDGTYTLVISAWGGSQRHEDTVEVAGDSEIEVRIPVSSIRGSVLADGEPVPGATLQLDALGSAPSFAMPIRSDEAGRFHLPAVPAGAYRLRASADGYAPGEREVTVEAGEPLTGVEVRLETAAGLVLQVRGAYGLPPETVRVAALEPSMTAAAAPPEDETPGGGPAAAYQERMSVGEEGRVRITAMPAGSWSLLVGGAGSATVRLEVTSPGPSVAVSLPPASQLRVRVPDLAESGQLGRVHLTGGDGRRHFSVGWRGAPVGNWTLVAGRTRVDDLPAGRWTVTATTPDGRTWSGTAVTGGGGTAEVVLE